MKIVVTGSLGHISKPLTQELLQKGHSVTVVSSKTEKQPEIEALGATAAIGKMEDAGFLTSAFTGADAVYCMLPAAGFFDPSFDLMAHITGLARNYKQAILASGVKKVLHLSSIGAHMGQGNGILLFHHLAEEVFRELPSDVALLHLRPVGFYYNLYSFIDSIKKQGVMASNYGADDRIPWVSTIDIAEVTAEELLTPFEGRRIRYIASEELTCNEIAGLLGAAIGKPELKWTLISDAQLLSGLRAAGMNPAIAEGFTEMNAAIHSGKLFEDYYRHRPALGKVKMTEFAREFAAVYQAK